MLPILMTASVSTRGMKGACFTDDERERMYLNALSYYLLALPDAKIVFAENSGWNLEGFARKLPEECRRRLGDVEFISLPIDLFDNSRGKGYNETIIIHEAVVRSKFIGEAGQFFKVTGRYPIYNLGFFLAEAEKALAKGGEIYCDVKDHKLYDWLGTGWTGHSFETRLFACTNDFFENVFYTRLPACNDYEGRLVENVYFEALKDYAVWGGKSLRFRREPHFGGLAGHTIDAASFSQKNDGLKSKAKRLVGNAIRITFPWFKF